MSQGDRRAYCGATPHTGRCGMSGTVPMQPPNPYRTARSRRLRVMHSALGDVYQYHDEPIALIAGASTSQDNAGRSERRRRASDAALRAPLGPRTLSTYHLRGHLPMPLRPGLRYCGSSSHSERRGTITSTPTSPRAPRPAPLRPFNFALIT